MQLSYCQVTIKETPKSGPHRDNIDTFAGHLEMDHHTTMQQFLKTGVLFFAILLSAFGRATGQNYVTPVLLTTLPGDLNETSGLLNLGGELWSHNDSGDDAILYQVNPADGEIIRTVEVTNADNDDWEDITQDADYIYIGDVGNNDGSRTDLKIYRVAKADLAASDAVEAEVINYHYSDQTSFVPSYHNTNFDCEALVHSDGSLYLFTKNWIDFKTNCYVLPDSPGDHEAVLMSSFDAGCLVTGATMLPSQGALVLIGYTSSGGSFTWVFDEFTGDDFFGGQATKLIWTVLSQIEGVCGAGSTDIYISSEEFAGFLDPSLYYLDLAGFLTRIGDIPVHDFRVSRDLNNLYVKTGPSISGTLQVFDLSGACLESRVAPVQEGHHPMSLYLFQLQQVLVKFSGQH